MLKELARGGYIDDTLPTVTGAVKDRFAGAAKPDGTIIHTIEEPIRKDGGIAVLKGNLAVDGAVVKQGAVAPEMMVQPGSGPSVRLRRGRHRRHPERQDRPRRRHCHPLRRAQGRSRYAGNAGSYLLSGRYGAGQAGGSHYPTAGSPAPPVALPSAMCLLKRQPGGLIGPGGRRGPDFHRHSSAETGTVGGRGNFSSAESQLEAQRTGTEGLYQAVCQDGNFRLQRRIAGGLSLIKREES